MVGDSGSGGTAGLAPAPSAGSAAAGKYLDASAHYTVPPAGAYNLYGTVITANTTLPIGTAQIYFCNATSPITVTLPSASSVPGTKYIVVQRSATSGANLTVKAATGDSIGSPNTQTTKVLLPNSFATQENFSSFVSDGVSNWLNANGL
jgi:hypothetical protein